MKKEKTRKESLEELGKSLQELEASMKRYFYKVDQLKERITKQKESLSIRLKSKG